MTATAMPSMGRSLLGQLARRATAAAPAPPPVDQRCDLCSAPTGEPHRHLLDLSDDGLVCVCPACRILFDHQAAGGDRYRLVPERRMAVDVTIDDGAWHAMGAPVGLAFFTYSSRVAGVVARYPSPAGPTEDAVPASAWQQLVAAVPALGDLAPDVEAFLVNRVRNSRQHWIVPIDDCYRLVAIIRSRWRGFTGGDELWDEIGRFFDDLATTNGGRRG